MEEVRVINIIQAKAYIRNGLQPIRCEVDDRIVFIFNKEDSKELYQKWKKREI